MTEKIRPLFTESDFADMDWHDCTVYAICFPRPGEYELIFDLDFIFEWIEPTGGSKYYNFLVSRSTLCFECVSNLKIEIESDSHIVIDSIDRDPDQGKWVIQFQEGKIELRSSGYKLFIIEYPILVSEQALGRPKDFRSFSRNTYKD